MKSMPNGKEPKRTGESKNFEGHMIAKSEIDKIRLKYVTFLTTRNRHVRQTTGNVMRAQQSKNEEIKLK